jgi:hypothetical protein
MTAPSSSAGTNLGEHLIDAGRAQRAVVLTGPNTIDLFQSGNGGFLYIAELVATRHAEEGRLAVIASSFGFRQHIPPGESPRALRLPAADAPIGHATREFTRGLPGAEPTLLILDYADLQLPAAAAGHAVPTADQQMLLETLASFPVDPALAVHRLVVIDRTNAIDPRLARLPGWHQISLDLPDEEHRLAMIERILLRHAVDPLQSAGLEDGLTAEEFARLTGGLSNDELKRAAVEAADSGKRLTARWAQEQKSARIRQQAQEGLDVVPPGRGLADVAGLPQVRLFLEERSACESWPRSIVLSGPPGVGKTLVVHAIADTLKWPAVSLGAFRSMWQGESERRLRAILGIIRAMAPIVVHIDEADQALGARGTGMTDGGTDNRILAELWSFLGDSDPGFSALFVLTTNRPDILDDATRSRSEIIPVLHPVGIERGELLRLACQAGGADLPLETCQAAIEASGIELFSGRMLTKAAQRAKVLTGCKGGGMADHLSKALRQLQERIDPINDERMSLLSVQMASFTTYLPWVAAEELGQEVHVPSYIQPLLMNGELDQALLSARIGELEHLARQRQMGVAS